MLRSLSSFFIETDVGEFEIKLQDDKLFYLQPQSNNHTLKKHKAWSKKINALLCHQNPDADFAVRFVGSEFQKKVWKATREIPFGKTGSYQEIAHQIGQPNAARAVGNALNKNPILIVIPCHRVISKSGAMGGFAVGAPTKKKLLDFEAAVSRLESGQ